jgi:hypothetical protein
MYVGNGQPRFREGKGLFFKSRGFVGYLHKDKRVTLTIIGKLHVTHPSNELAPLSIVRLREPLSTRWKCSHPSF